MTIKWSDYKWTFLGELLHKDLQVWCNDNDVTMGELAEMLGLSSTYFYHLPDEDYMPTVRNFMTIVNFCDLSPTDYFGIERLS